MKTAQIIIAPSMFFAFLFLANLASAASASVINGGSSVQVNVQSSQNISSVSQSTSKVKTHVRIESNGEVKEFNSDKPGSVSIESSDGRAQVHINNDSSTITSPATPTLPQVPTIINEAQKAAGEKIQGAISQKHNEPKSSFQKMIEKDFQILASIGERIKRFFSLNLFGFNGK